MTKQALTILPALLCMCAVAADMPDVEVHDFEKELGPFGALSYPPDLGPGAKPLVPELDASPGAAKTGKGALRFTYARRKERIDILTVNTSLAQFQLLELDVRATAPALFAISVEDLDGAKFHYACELRNQNWRHLALQPDDFKLSDDSKVKKEKLDPERLGPAFAMLDVSGIFQKTEGGNSLYLDNLAIKRKPMARKLGGWTVTRDTVVEEPLRVEGPLVVERGIKLVIKSKRVALKGNVTLKEGATLNLTAAQVSLECQHPYQFNIAVHEKSRFELDGCRMTLGAPWGVQLKKNSTAALKGCTFQGPGFTFDVQEYGSLAMDKTTGAGEAVIAPRTQVRLNECAGFLNWFIMPPGEPVRFDFPKGLEVPRWTAPSGAGHDAIVANSQGLMWGLVAMDGCDLTVPAAELRTVGFFFKGDAAREVKELDNDTTYAQKPLHVGASKLSLPGTKVQAFNFYLWEKAALKIEECTFGEVIAFGESKLTIAQATCDGTGGYFGARDRAQIHAKKCRIVGKVVAHDEARIVLEECDVEGDVFASDRGSLTLINCKVTGKKTRDSGATLSER